jgi:antitoxin CptB
MASKKPTDGAASATMSDVERQLLAKKLEWQCRRGMKELDILLVRYVRERLPAASSDEHDAFVEFLELPDPELAGYLLAGDVPDDPRHAALCRALLRAN